MGRKSPVQPVPEPQWGTAQAGPAPWLDRQRVSAAFDLAVQVRDYNPADIVDALGDMPSREVAQLACVLAAMVDIGAPIGQLRRWRHPNFVGQHEPPTETDVCKNGHAQTLPNVFRSGTFKDGRPRWLCRVCRRQVDAARDARRAQLQQAS